MRFLFCLILTVHVFACSEDEEKRSVCETGGTGTVVVTINGLPPSAGTPVEFSGPGGTTTIGATTTLTLAAGVTTVHANPVIVDDALVRAVYVGPENASFCVGPTAVTLVVDYTLLPTSNRLWVLSGTTEELAGFGSADLAATATVVAAVTASGPAGRDIAFDRQGNLWALGPTVSDALLNRFAADTFASSGPKTPDRAINLQNGGCIPLASALAFDNVGNLWVSSPCLNQVVRLSPFQLQTSANAIVPSASLDVADPGGLAFDASGNLWVTSAGGLLRFDAAQLSGANPAPATTITVEDATAFTLFGTDLAFDAAGNLWGDDFGANVFFKILATDLPATGTRNVTADVTITVSVLALLEGFAFDESGGLWTTFVNGQVARLAPSQLNTSTNAGAPTVPQVILSSADLGSTGGLAFFPAPSWSPLYAYDVE